MIAGDHAAVVPPRLFVYGTLQPGRLRWPLLAPFAIRHRPAAVPGTLHDTGNGWPIAVFDPADGEVPGVLVDLDADPDRLARGPRAARRDRGHRRRPALSRRRHHHRRRLDVGLPLAELDRGDASNQPLGRDSTSVELLDARGDRRGELDGPADGAQPVVRALHRFGQHGTGGVAVGAVREPDAEGHLDVGQPVAVVVADLARVDGDGERLWRGTARRQDVDVDRGAATDRGEEQLGRREVGVFAGAEGDSAAAFVGGGEPRPGSSARRPRCGAQETWPSRNDARPRPDRAGWR